MRKVLVMLTVLAMVGGMAAYADTLKKGDKEMNFSFAWDSFDPGGNANKVKTTTLNGSFGYLITDSQEVGGIVGYQKAESSIYDLGDVSLTSNSIGVFYNWNFKAGEAINPYVGVHVGMFGGDMGDIYDQFYGVTAGVKVYPWENAGFNFGLKWEKWTSALAGLDDGQDSNVFGGILIKF